MLGSFSFLAIRKHVSMSQSTSAGSAAQPAPTKWHRGIPSSSVRQFRQSLVESSMLLAVEVAKLKTTRNSNPSHEKNTS